jgi:hypothetical protein
LESNMGDPIARPIPLPTSSGLFGPDPGTTGFVDLSGLGGVETGGSAGVTVVIRQGSATGTFLCSIVLTTSGTDTKSLAHAVRSNGRLYAVVTGSGVIAGSAHIL